MKYGPFLITLLCFAALGQEESTPTTRVWGTRGGSYQLAISTDKNVYYRGDPIVLTAVVKNVSENPAWFRRMTPNTFYDMVIRTPVPSWIPFQPTAERTQLGQELSAPKGRGVAGFQIAPGKEIIDVFELNSLYQMAAVGEYKVVFSCRVPGYRIEDPSTTINSNETSLTILEKSK